MHCPLHRGDWSFHLTNEEKKKKELPPSLPTAWPSTHKQNKKKKKLAGTTLNPAPIPENNVRYCTTTGHMKQGGRGGVCPAPGERKKAMSGTVLDLLTTESREGTTSIMTRPSYRHPATHLVPSGGLFRDRKSKG